MKISIIGVGPGTKDYILPVARREISRCDCLIGARRHLSLFHSLGKEEVAIEGHFDRILSYIKQNKEKKRLAILVSGDPGMYSLLDKIKSALKPKDYRVIPGISTVQLAFARIGENWRDAEIISLHGRKADNLVDRVRSSSKIFIFTDQSFPPNRIAVKLLKEGIENKRAIVLENLSYPNERIIDTDLKHLTRMKSRFRLAAMIIEGTRLKVQGSRRGRLYGIGIGPGDPGLLTLKAKEILDRVDTIFTPKGSDDVASCSRSIVESVARGEKHFVELIFPMIKDKALLNRYWTAAAKRIAKEIHNGKDVAFVTIGDPFIYSTYAYLLDALRHNFPNIDVETIPGISAFNAASAKVNLTLVEGDETLAVVPVTKDLGALRETLERFNTVILMKVGSKLNKVVSFLKELGLARKAILLSRVGHSDERIIRDLTMLKDKKAGYLSVIIVKKG